MTTHFLLTNWDHYNGKFYLPFQTLVDRPDEVGEQYERPCFLFKWEIDNIRTRSQYWRARRLKQIRHATFKDGKVWDYVVKKTYETLDLWAHDCGFYADEICYGTNRVYKNHPLVYVTIAMLSDAIHRDQFGFLLSVEVGERGSRCLALYPDGFMVEGTVFNDYHISRGSYDTCITIAGIYYYSKSRLPKGMKLYLPQPGGGYRLC